MGFSDVFTKLFESIPWPDLISRAAAEQIRNTLPEMTEEHRRNIHTYLFDAYCKTCFVKVDSCKCPRTRAVVVKKGK